MLQCSFNICISYVFIFILCLFIWCLNVLSSYGVDYQHFEW